MLQPQLLRSLLDESRWDLSRLTWLVISSLYVAFPRWKMSDMYLFGWQHDIFGCCMVNQCPQWLPGHSWMCFYGFPQETLPFLNAKNETAWCALNVNVPFSIFSFWVMDLMYSLFANQPLQVCWVKQKRCSKKSWNTAAKPSGPGAEGLRRCWKCWTRDNQPQVEEWWNKPNLRSISFEDRIELMSKKKQGYKWVTGFNMFWQFCLVARRLGHVLEFG